MKKYLILRFLSIVFVIVVVLYLPILVSLRSPIAQAQKTETEIQNQIKDLEAKLERSKAQVNSLAKEVNILEQNIELKGIQIKQAEYQIEQKIKELEILEEDIRLLEIRLERLDGTISTHQKLLDKRIRKSYIDGRKSFFELMIGSESLGGAVSQLEYLKRIEIEDRELIKQMNQTKDNYENQQKILEEKRKQVKAIKAQIEAQKKQAELLQDALESQKKEKDHLLRVTKNDEKVYQKRLEDAKKELSQIQSAANVVIREGEGIKVKKSETVGTMGNSGFSTGAHLHFGVYKYSQEDFEEHDNWGWYYSNYANPLDYLKSKSITWGTGCYRDPQGKQSSGSGDWEWPMSQPRITQSYGSKTCYNWMYGGKPHPALDMVGIGDISVKSVADGEAYFCRNCLGDGGNGVFIFHSGNQMTLYWHLR